MNESLDGIWFVYDGECPICNYAAHALKIRQQYGSLNLLDARSEQAHPLLRMINQRGLDLDEGMVIYQNGKFYHGRTALRFMAQYGEAEGVFNWFNKALFWSDYLVALVYPWMRGCRNWLVHLRGKHKIDNLNRRDQPIFHPVFAKDWEGLPPVIKKHYAVRPYCENRVVVEGVLEVQTKGVMKLLAPFYRILGGVPMVSEAQVPVIVNFAGHINSRAFHFNRLFHFHHHKPYSFRSRMLQLEGNRVVEIMRFGICWLTRYEWRDNKVFLRHDAYALHWLGHFIPLPLHWLIGKGDAEEWAVDEDQFDMQVVITHPLFGEMYFYRGRFRVVESA